jgi:hypothetical protein
MIGTGVNSTRGHVRGVTVASWVVGALHLTGVGAWGTHVRAGAGGGGSWEAMVNFRQRIVVDPACPGGLYLTGWEMRCRATPPGQGSRTELVGPREQLARELKSVRKELKKQTADRKRKNEEDKALQAQQQQQQQRQRTSPN